MPVLGKTILSYREHKQRRRRRKSLLKSEFTLFQGSLLLFHPIQFVKCWRSFLELNSKGLYLRLRKELKKIVFSCSRRCLQPPQRNVQKSVKNEQSLVLLNKSKPIVFLLFLNAAAFIVA